MTSQSGRGLVLICMERGSGEQWDSVDFWVFWKIHEYPSGDFSKHPDLWANLLLTGILETTGYYGITMERHIRGCFY